jgi:hypothetical protein
MLGDLIVDVIKATSSPSVPRQLQNVLWTFDRHRASKWLESLKMDTQANTNLLRRALFNIVSCGPNGENINVAQGLLENLRRRSFNVALGTLLPRLLPRAALRLHSLSLMTINKSRAGLPMLDRSVCLIPE